MKKTLGFALAVVAIATVGCGNKGGSGDAVAIVNGDAISMSDFYAYLENKHTVQVQISNRQIAELPVPQNAPLKFQALRDLIQRQVILQLAKDEGVFPGQADINKELDFQTKRQPDFVQSATRMGLTLEQLKNDLAFELCRTRILTKGITVTDQDVKDFFAKHPETQVEPEVAEMYMVVVGSDADKTVVDQALAQGNSFLTVAKQYSKAPNARTNPGITVPILANTPAVIKNVVQKLKQGANGGVNASSDWIKDGQNWVKFNLQRDTPSKAKEIKDTDRELVRRQIAAERGAQATDFDKRVKEKLRKSKIDISYTPVKAFWDNATKQSEAIENAKATAAATPATGGAASAGTTPTAPVTNPGTTAPIAAPAGH